MSHEAVQADNPQRTKASPVLFVRFIGEKIRPERVPLSALARVLKAINLIVGPPAHVKTKKRELPDPGAFQLVSISQRSATYGFDGTRKQETFDLFRNLGRTIADPSSANGIEFPLKAVEDLSSVASRMRCRLEITRKEHGGREVLARIDRSSARALKSNLLVEGETTIYGEIKRVGGVTAMRCSVRLPSQDSLLYCRIANGKLSRKLGKSLYKEVVLHGRATWIRSNWRIVKFEIQGVDVLKDASASEVFDHIRETGGSDWDSIADPESFLNGEERSE